jgi:hypothetical protein
VNPQADSTSFRRPTNLPRPALPGITNQKATKGFNDERKGGVAGAWGLGVMGEVAPAGYGVLTY